MVNIIQLYFFSWFFCLCEGLSLFMSNRQ